MMHLRKRVFCHRKKYFKAILQACGQPNKTIVLTVQRVSTHKCNVLTMLPFARRTRSRSLDFNLSSSMRKKHALRSDQQTLQLWLEEVILVEVRSRERQASPRSIRTSEWGEMSVSVRVSQPWFWLNAWRVAGCPSSCPFPSFCEKTSRFLINAVTVSGQYGWDRQRVHPKGVFTTLKK